MAKGIVLELQQDCLNSAVSVSAILRKAKAIAIKLDLSDFAEWIDEELNGYTCAMGDLPEHRKVGGTAKFWNPFHGWCPIISQDEKFSDILSNGYLPNPVAQLEEWASKPNGTLTYRYPHVIQEALQKGESRPFEAVMHISVSQVTSALEHVRNKVLDWTLRLEKSGILGENFTFDEQQKQAAATVTNHIYHSNIGVLGDVAGNAAIKGQGVSDGLNFEQVTLLAQQIREASKALPPTVAQELETHLQAFEDGASQKSTSKVKSAIQLMIPVLQGAGGNLAASGILSALGA